MATIRSVLQFPLSSFQLHTVARAMSAASSIGNTCKNPSLGFKSKHLAAGSVEPKTDPSQVTFYNMRFCPYAQRTALVLMAKGIPFENVNIHLKNKPDWFVTKNPISGKVPVIECEGVTVRESAVICDYLDEKFPEKRLSSATPEGRARDKEMVEISKKIYGSLHNSLHAKTDEDMTRLRASFNRGLSDFEDELKSRGTEFYGGDSEPGMLDFMVWPWFERIDAFPLKEDLHKNYPVLNDYIARMWEIPVIKDYALALEDHMEFWVGLVNKVPKYDLIYERTKAKL